MNLRFTNGTIRQIKNHFEFIISMVLYIYAFSIYPWVTDLITETFDLPAVGCDLRRIALDLPAVCFVQTTTSIYQLWNVDLPILNSYYCNVSIPTLSWFTKCNYWLNNCDFRFKNLNLRYHQEVVNPKLWLITTYAIYYLWLGSVQKIRTNSYQHLQNTKFFACGGLAARSGTGKMTFNFPCPKVIPGPNFPEWNT